MAIIKFDNYLLLKNFSDQTRSSYLRTLREFDTDDKCQHQVNSGEQVGYGDGMVRSKPSHICSSVLRLIERAISASEIPGQSECPGDIQVMKPRSGWAGFDIHTLGRVI